VIDAETLEGARRYFEEDVPFNRFLGLKVGPVVPGKARVTLAFRPELIGDTERPALHGGVLSTLIDAACGLAVWTKADGNDRISTIDLRVDYLRPGRSEPIVVDAVVVRVGNRVGVSDAVAYHQGDEANPIATGKGVYNIARRGKNADD
jgi:uncharacterized protein (TIGR00369 family)